MKEAYQPFIERKRMTRLGEAVAKGLRRQKKPLVEDEDIWKIIVQIYDEKAVSYLRGDAPDAGVLARVKDLLRSERVISRDEDYRRVWRVNELPDIQADEVVCLLDEATCISHLSAMQIYNLTDRRPRTLFLTVGTNEEWKQRNRDEISENEFAPIRSRRHHPEVVRSRRLNTLNTKNFPRTTQMKASHVRATEIGETFLNMLEQPERCGGMAHILGVYDKHASTYLKQIVRAIDQNETKLTKVRAGYILSERLGFHDAAIESWSEFAQRGGSQRLDPKAPYEPTFSERWMISINV